MPHKWILKYWLSCRSFTVQVNTDDGGIIVFAAPVVRKFVGQPLDNLIAWMRKIDGFTMESLS